MGRKEVNRNVMQAGLDRMMTVYEKGHRVIVSTSGGKDSTIILELAIMAAKETRNLPVEALFRDDEIFYPGTSEYLERVYDRPEVNLHWMVNHQASPNIYNRELPFYWAFDPSMDRSDWVREFPDYATIDTENINLYSMVNPHIYPPPKGKKLVSVLGIRTTESLPRLYAIHSAKGTRAYSADHPDMYRYYPIYDWRDGDVWLAIQKFGWDYNHAYDSMAKLGVPAKRQRIAPAAMTALNAYNLQYASKAWPRWFNKVCDRLPGIRAVTYYGELVMKPERMLSQSWQECYHEQCIDKSPPWISERAIHVKNHYLQAHAAHTQEPFPEVSRCAICDQSWKFMTWGIYSGDPFRIVFKWYKAVEPSEFRDTETRLHTRSQLKPKAEHKKPQKATVIK